MMDFGLEMPLVVTVVDVSLEANVCFCSNILCCFVLVSIQ